jgi:exodeoxyribonuclease VII large subunit
MDMEHLSLFELNKTIAEVMAKNLEPSYWVVAEIGEIRTHANGHCYLELVEKEDHLIKAKTRATIWSYTYRNLSVWFQGITGQSLKAGMKILFNATVQYHEVYGLSLNIRDIDAQYTLGERAKKRQEIIAQLEKDGIFNMNKELELPIVPQRVAVISSETAAGFGDFMDQLSGNEYSYTINVELFNSVMQGDKAEASIIGSMHRVFEKASTFDMLVIIRGGGATLDLDCFDSYELASHIAQFPIPVITGIGHERDETIADLVAHTKMKTPTAVAEFIISGFRNFELILNEKLDVITETLNDTLANESAVIDQIMFRFQRATQRKLDVQNMLLNNQTKSLFYGHQIALKAQDRKLTEFAGILAHRPRVMIEKQDSLLHHLEKELEVLHPENVLKRGYSITTIDGQSINKVEKIDKDAKIVTLTSRLKIESKYLSEIKRD